MNTIKFVIYALIGYWVYRNIKKEGIYWIPKILLNKVTKRMGGIFTSFGIAVYLSRLIMMPTFLSHILFIIIATFLVLFIFKKAINRFRVLIQDKIDSRIKK